MSSHRSPSEVRASLKHPIIDGDGHWVEYNPVFAERMRKLAGDKAADGFLASQRRIPDALKLSIAERKQRGIAMEGYWTRQTTNTRDRATAMLPRLLYDRLDELGIDFGIVYPTAGLSVPRVPDDATRRAVCRGFNLVTAEYFDKLGDRLSPAAVIPMFTPEEAIEELEFCVKQLGTKVAMFGNAARRMAKAKDVDSDLARHTVTYERFGIDSDFDYDPVWQKCRELGIAPAFHSSAMGWQNRASISSYVYNHVGMLGESHHALAKSLFLGGVTRRFPDLNFGFLEGGVGWACNLYGDLFGHWEKRNRTFMDQHLKPTNLDTAEFRRLFEQYTAGNPRYAGKIDDIIARNLDALESDTSQAELTERDLDSDDFARVHIDGPDDIRRLFTQNFYFGCEADDPMTSIAFDEKMGLQLKPLLGSDIAHFDVIDATEVLEEAYELVEDGHITEQNFREFTFSNVVQLYRSMNPSFFAGTVVEADAEAEFARYQGSGA